MTKEYDSPEVTEYGSVTTITEAGTNKKGSDNDEFSGQTGLTGSTTGP